MPRRFRLRVFDWDGTLMDSAETIATSLQAACRDVDVPVPPDERARHIIGLGLREALEYAVPGLAQERYPELVERYREHWRLGEPQTALFPGAAEAIEALREAGFLLAIATGKSRRGLDRALDSSGLTGAFHASRCADEAASKPHPQMLLELMQACGAAPEETLMIGDTTHDLQMARNAGVASLAAGYGAHPRGQLLALDPLACVDDIAALKRWLDRHA